jgi:hypothetical protein
MQKANLLLALLLTSAACGGEPDAPPPATDPAPPAADQTQTTIGAAPSAAPGCWLMRGTAAEAAERASPRDSASVAIAGGTLQVCYGGPSARGRTIVGGLDPHGQPWRMGADEATALHVTTPVQVGDVRLEPGSYSIYGIPNPDSWTIVLNRNAERWGIPIDEGVRAQDVGEITVTPETMAEPVETLRYRFEPRGERAVDLLMEFESTRIRLPIESVGG